MNQEPDERRCRQRVPTRSLVEVRLPTWEVLRYVYTTNLSTGGMRLSLGARPPVGMPIDVILTLPNGHRLHLPGKVANLSADAGDAGVKFEELPSATRQEIERYIDEIRTGRVPESPPPSAIPPGVLIKK